MNNKKTTRMIVLLILLEIPKITFAQTSADRYSELATIRDMFLLIGLPILCVVVPITIIYIIIIKIRKRKKISDNFDKQYGEDNNFIKKQSIQKRKKKKILIIFAIIGIFIVCRFVLFNHVKIKVIDKDTGKPIKNATIAIAHEFFLEIDPNVTIKKLTTDKSGKVSQSFAKTEKLFGAMIHKEGYYPNSCSVKNNSLKISSNEVSLKAIKNPIKNIIYKKVALQDYLEDFENALKIQRQDNDLIKNKDFSLFQENQKDINVIFTRQEAGYDFKISKISFYGEGGIQKASTPGTIEFLNITEAPTNGYSTTESIRWPDDPSMSYIFKTADGKHYGKMYYNSSSSATYFDVFLNPNENDRNLEYYLNKDCLNLEDPYASIDINCGVAVN